MRNLIRIAASLLVVGLTVLQSGCWDMVEVSRSSLLTGIALEPGKDGRIRVTIEILNTAEAMSTMGGKGGAPSELDTNEAYTIPEAIVQLNEKFDRMLIPSHVRVIIIDERLARKGLDHFIDFIQRSRFIREDVILLVSRGVRASDLLRIAYPGGLYASQGIQFQVSNYYRNWGGIPRSYLYTVAQTSSSAGRELMLGAVTVSGDAKAGESMDSVKSLEPKAIVLLTGAAVFRQNKLVGFLPAEDVNNTLIVSNQLKGTTLSVPLKEHGRYMAFRLFHVHTDKHVRMIEGKPQITVNVEGIGNVASLDSPVPIDKVKGYQELEGLASSALEDRISVSIEKVQKDYGSDIFGFGEFLYRHHYREFKSVAKTWNERFSKATVKVKVTIRLERSDLKSKKLGLNPLEM